MRSNAGFVPIPGRDAWAAIRGYVYQVDITLLRWLSLAENDTVALECGEDIDIISQHIRTGDTTETARLLEQIKRRNGRVSLRSPDALTGIVNAVVLRQSNRKIALLHRFTTNAAPGRERGIPDLDGVPAITRWQQLRAPSLLPTATGSAYLKAIRYLLSNARKPTSVSAASWQLFSEWIVGASDDALMTFIRAFEWGTNAGTSQDVSREVQSILIEQQLARDALHALEQYRKLFVTVFSLLSREGDKVLTRAELHQYAAEPTLSDADHALLLSLRTHYADIAQRVDSLSQQVATQGIAVDGLTHHVQALARKESIGLALECIRATPALQAPRSALCPLFSPLPARGTNPTRSTFAGEVERGDNSCSNCFSLNCPGRGKKYTPKTGGGQWI